MGHVQKQAYLAAVLNERVYWSDTLKEIGNCVPPQLRLTKMSTKGEEIYLEGEIKSAQMSEEKVLTECMNRLGQGIFKKVDLVSTKQGTAPGEPYQFKLKLNLE